MAAGATYEPIATTTLGSAQSTITFSSIPSTYTDLRLVLVGTGTIDGNDVIIRYNSDTATNYSWTNLQGDGTSATSTRVTTSADNRISAFSNYISNTIPKMYTADIFSYSGSTNKTALFTGSGDKNGSGVVSTAVSLWRSTAVINTITLSLSGGNFAAGTTATLYGIKAA